MLRNYSYCSDIFVRKYLKSYATTYQIVAVVGPENFVSVLGDSENLGDFFNMVKDNANS